jgi:hypothetical protein
MKVFIDPQSMATVHPSSVNAGALDGFTRDLMVYFGNLKTSQLFLLDTTIVSAYSLLLFGGDITIDHKQVFHFAALVLPLFLFVSLPSVHSTHMHTPPHVYSALSNVTAFPFPRFFSSSFTLV